MARLKMPGRKRVKQNRRKKLHSKVTSQTNNKEKPCIKQVESPLTVTAAQFHEIFGDSDEEEVFYGFDEEVLGLQHFRRIFSPKSHEKNFVLEGKEVQTRRGRGRASKSTNIKRRETIGYLENSVVANASPVSSQHHTPSCQDSNPYAKQYFSYRRESTRNKRTAEAHVSDEDVFTPTIKNGDKVELSIPKSSVKATNMINPYSKQYRTYARERRSRVADSSVTRQLFTTKSITEDNKSNTRKGIFSTTKKIAKHLVQKAKRDKGMKFTFRLEKCRRPKRDLKVKQDSDFVYDNNIWEKRAFRESLSPQTITKAEVIRSPGWLDKVGTGHTEIMEIDEENIKDKAKEMEKMREERKQRIRLKNDLGGQTESNLNDATDNEPKLKAKRRKRFKNAHVVESCNEIERYPIATLDDLIYENSEQENSGSVHIDKDPECNIFTNISANTQNLKMKQTNEDKQLCSVLEELHPQNASVVNNVFSLSEKRRTRRSVLSSLKNAENSNCNDKVSSVSDDVHVDSIKESCTFGSQTSSPRSVGNTNNSKSKRTWNISGLKEDFMKTRRSLRSNTVRHSEISPVVVIEEFDKDLVGFTSDENLSMKLDSKLDGKRTKTDKYRTFDKNVVVDSMPLGANNSQTVTSTVALTQKEKSMSMKKEDLPLKEAGVVFEDISAKDYGSSGVLERNSAAQLGIGAPVSKENDTTIKERPVRVRLKSIDLCKSWSLRKTPGRASQHHELEIRKKKNKVFKNIKVCKASPSQSNVVLSEINNKDDVISLNQAPKINSGVISNENENLLPSTSENNSAICNQVISSNTDSANKSPMTTLRTLRSHRVFSSPQEKLATDCSTVSDGDYNIDSSRSDQANGDQSLLCEENLDHSSFTESHFPPEKATSGTTENKSCRDGTHRSLDSFQGQGGVNLDVESPRVLRSRKSSVDKVVQKEEDEARPYPFSSFYTKRTYFTKKQRSLRENCDASKESSSFQVEKSVADALISQNNIDLDASEVGTTNAESLLQKKTKMMDDDAGVENPQTKPLKKSLRPRNKEKENFIITSASVKDSKQSLSKGADDGSVVNECANHLITKEKSSLKRTVSSSRDRKATERNVAKENEKRKRNKQKEIVTVSTATGEQIKKPTRLVRCGTCTGCRNEECGVCLFCRDKKKNGGNDVYKKSCIRRKCLSPRPPQRCRVRSKPVRKVERSELDNKETPKLQPHQIANSGEKLTAKSPPKKRQTKIKAVEKEEVKYEPTEERLDADITPELRPSSKKKDKRDSQKDAQSSKMEVAIPNSPLTKPRLRSSAITEDLQRPRAVCRVAYSGLEAKLKIPWPVDTDEDAAWLSSYYYCLSYPVHMPRVSMCFLCGSGGGEKMICCVICSETFHDFCLELDPLDEDQWCCDRCKFCKVCGYKENLLMCDKCHDCYHAECLGPNYQKETVGSDEIWVCGRCIKCTKCGKKTPGKRKDSKWMHAFTMCDDCSRQWRKGCFCPVCKQVYEEDDFNAKMIMCSMCDCWIHMECEGLNEDEYECLTDLPEDVPYICKLCHQGDTKPAWYTEVKDELQAGFQKVYYEIIASRDYHALQKLLLEDKICPADPNELTMDTVFHHIEDNYYTKVDEFATECYNILEHFTRKQEEKQGKAVNASVLKLVFFRYIQQMFPWYNSQDLEKKSIKICVDDPGKENTATLLPPTLAATALDDHSYYRVDDAKQKGDSISLSKKLPIVEEKLLTNDGLEKEPHNDKIKPLIEEDCKTSQCPRSNLFDDTLSDSKSNIFDALTSTIPFENSSATREAVNQTTRQTDEVNTLEEEDKTLPEPLNIDEEIKDFVSQCSLSEILTQSEVDDDLRDEEDKESSSPDTSMVQPIASNIPANAEALTGLVGDLKDDERRCLFCNQHGDRNENWAGRLLLAGMNEWVHVNCALWSAEVFEDKHGRLQNVQAALSRGNKLKCDLCQQYGATVGCCSSRCPLKYHFECSRRAEMVFQDDKKAYCKQHCFRVKKHLIMSDNDFGVERRVLVDLTRTKSLKKYQQGIDPKSIKVFSGSIVVHRLGHLDTASDTKQALIPMGYRVSRIFWSTSDPRKRCKYTCSVMEKEKPKEKPSVDNTNDVCLTGETFKHHGDGTRSICRNEKLTEFNTSSNNCSQSPVEFILKDPDSTNCDSSSMEKLSAFNSRAGNHGELSCSNSRTCPSSIANPETDKHKDTVFRRTNNEDEQLDKIRQPIVTAKTYEDFRTVDTVNDRSRYDEASTVSKPILKSEELKNEKLVSSAINGIENMNGVMYSQPAKRFTNVVVKGIEQDKGELNEGTNGFRRNLFSPSPVKIVRPDSCIDWTHASLDKPKCNIVSKRLDTGNQIVRPTLPPSLNSKVNSDNKHKKASRIGTKRIPILSHTTQTPKPSTVDFPQESGVVGRKWPKLFLRDSADETEYKLKDGGIQCPGTRKLQSGVSGYSNILPGPEKVTGSTSMQSVSALPPKMALCNQTAGNVLPAAGVPNNVLLSPYQGQTPLQNTSSGFIVTKQGITSHNTLQINEILGNIREQLLKYPSLLCKFGIKPSSLNHILEVSGLKNFIHDGRASQLILIDLLITELSKWQAEELKRLSSILTFICVEEKLSTSSVLSDYISQYLKVPVTTSIVSQNTITFGHNVNFTSELTRKANQGISYLPVVSNYSVVTAPALQPGLPVGLPVVSKSFSSASGAGFTLCDMASGQMTQQANHLYFQSEIPHPQVFTAVAVAPICPSNSNLTAIARVDCGNDPNVLATRVPVALYNCAEGNNLGIVRKNQLVNGNKDVCKFKESSNYGKVRANSRKKVERGIRKTQKSSNGKDDNILKDHSLQRLPLITSEERDNNVPTFTRPEKRLKTIYPTPENRIKNDSDISNPLKYDNVTFYRKELKNDESPADNQQRQVSNPSNKKRKYPREQGVKTKYRKLLKLEEVRLASMLKVVLEREREKDTLDYIVVIKNEEGWKVESNSLEDAWRQLICHINEIRMDQKWPVLPCNGQDVYDFLGLSREPIVYLAEQLPGGHRCKKYRFQYHLPCKEDDDVELPTNPHGCARAEGIKRSRKDYDMFAWLCSSYRTLPPVPEETDDGIQGTAQDLPMAMRYRQLKCTVKDYVGVYQSLIHARGLFCKRPIEIGEMIIEYAGTVIRASLTDRREDYYEKKGYGCYMFRIDDLEVVDATLSGNAARFINHSCEPNCYSKIISVDGQKKIIIFAGRRIQVGEELTYDYKFPLEDEKIPCTCGAKKCRKYLN